MTELLKLDAAKQGSRIKGGKSVAGVFVRNDILYVRKRVDGKLVPYSTGKKDTEANRKWVEYHSEAIWQEKASEARKNVLSHNLKTRKTTLAEYGTAYYGICPSTRDEKTHERMKYDFDTYVVPVLGDMLLSEITASNIEDWQLRMLYYPDPVPDPSNIGTVRERRGHSRLKNLRSCLTLVLSQAVYDGIIASSPAMHVKLKKKASKRRTISIEEAESIDEKDLEDIFTKETVAYSEDEIKRLLSVCDDIIAEKRGAHHRLIWVIFKQMMVFKFYSGVRSGEAIALMWKYVDLEKNEIRIQFTMREGELKLPKENKTRVIDILPEAKRALVALKELTGNTAWVFLSSRGKPYKNPYGPARLWNQVTERAQVKKARFYNTRHSFVTNMISRGLHTEWLIQQLGHESIVITRQHYEGHIEPDWSKLTDSLES